MVIAVVAAGVLAAAMEVKAHAVERRAASQPATVIGAATPLAIAAATTPAAAATTPAAAALTTIPVLPPAPVTNTCAVTAGLAAAVAVAVGRGEQAGVAVLDTMTGAYVSAGSADTAFDTASVVKVLIATQLLLRGQMTAVTAQQMMVLSDDDAADALYGLAGGDDMVTDVAAHYGITLLGSAPADTGQWGESTVTADGLAHLYAALKADPVVWPWLSQAMSAAQQTAADGTNQFFGIPAATTGWAIKQGWMVGLGPGATYNTTGYVDGGRYVVVILTHGPVADYDSVLPATLSAMARDVIPAGGVGAATATCPA